MFVGHYAAALAAKAAEPRAPLWAYVIGCQLMDVGWAGLVAAGVERAHTDPSLPGSGLVLDYMPFTHSLPGALLWSIGGALVARIALRLPWRAAVFVGLTVFSHWLADLLVHRPDLELWFGGQKVGLGLWNYPVPEQAVEMGLLAAGAVAWGWRRGVEGQGPWPGVGFLLFLLALQIVAMMTPPGGGPVQMGAMTLAVYLLAAVIAWLADRGRSQPRLT
jgi:membrane-bound metal-dependent hydrolase YbcI (DUF457 family)